jgi:putative addiction module component (TIGR02574 family)
MSTDQITAAALALPMSDRVQLAQALWVSIDRDIPESDAIRAVEESAQRADELDSGAVKGKPHEDVMRELRRSL